MRTALTLLATTIALCASGCSNSDTQEAGFTGASDRPYHDHSSHDHGTDTDPAAPAHAEGHASNRLLATTLVAPSDLPAGYVVGAHHEQPASGSGNNPASCAPLSTLLAPEHAGTHGGTHGGEHGGEHPQAVTVLSKSHFGPQLMEKVVDYGTVAAAESALDDLRATLTDCSRYVHSASAIGANTYRVEPGPSIAAPAGAVSVRLTTVSPDFTGDSAINWDVWTTRVDSRLLTVAFRSAPGGDNADLPDAVRAALTKQETAP